MKIRPGMTPPYKVVGLATLVVLAVFFGLVYMQFKGTFTPRTRLTMIADRAGLVMDRGSKVTYNGVQIGRVAEISVAIRDHKPVAQFFLDINPKYVSLIPQNVDIDIRATTVFGGKYISLSTPQDSTPRWRNHRTIIFARSVTTEIPTLFQTLSELAQKVDPVKINLALGSLAQSLSNLGDKFGQSIVNAGGILNDVNPQLPQARLAIKQLAALGDIYADASPDLLDFLNKATTTSRTLSRHQTDLDRALLSAAGLGNVGTDVFEHAGPYLARGAADLDPTAQLLDTYSPEIFCLLRNYHDVRPIIGAAEGGRNG